MSSIYRSQHGKNQILNMYDKLQSQIDTKFESRFIDTRFGKTPCSNRRKRFGPAINLLSWR